MPFRIPPPTPFSPASDAQGGASHEASRPCREGKTRHAGYLSAPRAKLTTFTPINVPVPRLVDYFRGPPIHGQSPPAGPRAVEHPPSALARRPTTWRLSNNCSETPIRGLSTSSGTQSRARSPEQCRLSPVKLCATTQPRPCIPDHSITPKVPAMVIGRAIGSYPSPKIGASSPQHSGNRGPGCEASREPPFSTVSTSIDRSRPFISAKGNDREDTDYASSDVSPSINRSRSVKAAKGKGKEAADYVPPDSKKRKSSRSRSQARQRKKTRVIQTPPRVTHAQSSEGRLLRSERKQLDLENAKSRGYGWEFDWNGENIIREHPETENMMWDASFELDRENSVSRQPTKRSASS